MNIGPNGEKESPDDKDTVNGVSGKKRSLNQCSDLKADASEQAEIHGATAGRSQSSGVFHIQQQMAGQNSVVCWERFLHVRTIRVLLVENDDCTRHVVSALLRNCNYEVVDASNGLQAWKILENLDNHIDIVLTEVVMSPLSGIALLCKILSHKTRKTVPVIMMSSLDSMGLVFKCLSRGAVDFLVKPVRKNELKNLWQHVWRRCHSSSGSGSESGTQTQKSVKSKASEKLGNSSGDDEEYNANNGLNAGDTSDDGSGAESSWTKQAVEVDSSQALSPMDQTAEGPDSTCAQVIRSNDEYTEYSKLQLSLAREGRGPKLSDIVGNEKNHVEGQQHDPIGRELESAREIENTFDLNNNATDDSKEPNLELSLKRVRGDNDIDRSVQDERYVLRRSEQKSAFSRYNTSTSIFKPPSSYLVDNSTEAAKRESVGDIQVFPSDHIVYQSSNGVSNNIDMGSTTDKLLKDKSEATSAINGLHPSAFRSVKNEIRYNKPSFCGSTNVLGGPTLDGNNNAGNRSGSGSNHGSSVAVNVVGNNNNAESDFGRAGNKVDEIRFAQREAALMKFRQKKKERCFKKNVRYQNRKKLAEQRPRVRGQFVKQTEVDGSNRSGGDQL